MKTNCPLPVLLSVLALASTAPAAVLNLGNYTKTTDGDQTFSALFNGGAQLFSYNSGNIYVVVNTAFTNITSPGVLDITESYGGYSHSGGDVFGQLWQQSNIGIAYYGERNTATPIPVGTPVTLVIKYELNAVGLDGDTVKFWVNPTLGTGVEGTPTDSDPTRLWNPTTITSDDMRFRRGNSSENTLQFSNIQVYNGGSSPFALVPEPSAPLLTGLGLLGLLGRRRHGN